MISFFGKAVLAGTLAGTLGTGLGGVFVAILGRPRRRLLCFFLSFSAGVMLAVIFQELLPEALESGSISLTIFGLIAGGLALAAAARLLPQGTGGTGERRLLRTGILIGLGIAFHNVPEGIAIGAGYASGEKLGLSLTLALALHDIPEGMAMAAPLRGAGKNMLRVLVWTIIAGLPTGLGALLGALFGNLSPGALASALSFAGGAMLYLVLRELLPEAQRLHSAGLSSLGAFIGVMVGIIIPYLI